MLGKLSLAAIPLHEPLPLISGAVVVLIILAVLAFIAIKGWVPYLWREWLTSVDHKRIGVMYFTLGLRHAAARLRRCDHDAHAAGHRGRRFAGIPAAPALRPDLLGARHDHDLFRGHAAGHRIDELCRAAAARRARRRLPGAQFGQLLAHRKRGTADQRVARRRRVLARNLVGLSAPLRARLLARCRRRLLPLVIADFGRRDAAHRRQFRDHDSQIACPGHDLFPHAGVLLDRAVPPIC